MAARFPARAALALTLVGPSSVAADTGGPPLFDDTVSTLVLDSELDARGNLGGITVDQLGFIYVANFRDAAWRISPDGEVMTLSRGLYGASGNTIDSRGDLWQANFNGNTITRITRSGDESLMVTEGLDGPVGLQFGPDGALYVCNCRANTLSRVATDGTVATFAESDRFACPNGITSGGDGALYVTNFNNHDILRVAPDTGTVDLFTTVPGGAGNAHIAYAKGVFYVTKIIANQVVKVAESGEVLPVAGSGQPGHDDGPGPQATFFRPNGIAVSPQGDRLYVNTMVGEYSQPVRSRLTIRVIELVTLTRVLDRAMADGGLDALSAAYADYKADPVRRRENTVGEMIAYGYRFLSARQVSEALQVFGMNADSYPATAAAQFHLGEAYRYIGRTEEAIEQYRKVLAIDPADRQAASRLAQLAAASDSGG